MHKKNGEKPLYIKGKLLLRLMRKGITFMILKYTSTPLLSQFDFKEFGQYYNLRFLKINKPCYAANFCMLFIVSFFIVLLFDFIVKEDAVLIKEISASGLFL